MGVNSDLMVFQFCVMNQFPKAEFEENGLRKWATRLEAV